MSLPQPGQANPAPSNHPVVAVTGVGAIIGQGIVKSLRQSRHAVRIVGIDRSLDSPAPEWVDHFEQKPIVEESSPAYLAYWRGLVERHGVDLILPGLDVDMMFLDRQRAFFAELGVRVALNTSELIAQTADKWQFIQTLEMAGYLPIPSARPQSWQEAQQLLGPPPLLMKPLQGSGSRGIVLLSDETDFTYWRNKNTAPWMLQRVVGTPDNEYTVGVFGLGQGAYRGPLIFRRKLSPTGSTQRAEVVAAHPVLQAATHFLCSFFRPLGPTNFQFRLEDEHAYLLEINPRFSSSNSLRTAFGFNEAEMAIDFYLYGTEPPPPAVREGTAWRYAEDAIRYAGHSF